MSLARDVTLACGGDWHGRYGLIPTPGHSAHDRGTKVADHPNDRDDIVVVSFNGGDWRAIKDDLRARGLLSTSAAEPHDPSPGCARRAAKPETPTAVAAGRLWHEAANPPGTPVEAWLLGRGVNLPVDANDVLRFHPRAPHGRSEDGRLFRLPAMIALMRDVLTGEPVAVHRTALDSDVPKADRRKMLGPAAGAAVMLCENATVMHRLGIAEGIETALSVLQAGWEPVWALCSAGAIARFPVLPVVAELTVFADPDEVGQAAARQCAQRWAEAGREAYVQTPYGGDFNDIVMRRQRAA